MEGLLFQHVYKDAIDDHYHVHVCYHDPNGIAPSHLISYLPIDSTYVLLFTVVCTYTDVK